MKKRFWLGGLCAVLLLCGVAFGQEPLPPEPAASQQNSMTVQQILQTGGWPMYVLGLMSILGVALVVYFTTSLRPGQITPHGFTTDLRNMILENRMDDALHASRKNGSPIGEIARSALEYTQREDEPDAELLRDVIEGEGNRQAVTIQNKIQYLLDIAVIAPMVGLLGTVMGMLVAFNSIAQDVARAKPVELAHGVSQALITTAAGLMVGIPAMMAYAYFRGRATRLISNLEATSAHFLTLLGHRLSK